MRDDQYKYDTSGKIMWRWGGQGGAPLVVPINSVARQLVFVNGLWSVTAISCSAAGLGVEWVSEWVCTLAEPDNGRSETVRETER